MRQVLYLRAEMSICDYCAGAAAAAAPTAMACWNAASTCGLRDIVIGSRLAPFLIVVLAPRWRSSATPSPCVSLARRACLQPMKQNNQREWSYSKLEFQLLLVCPIYRSIGKKN